MNLAAPPGTDIWKKPPSHDVFTAPHHPLKSGPLSKFLTAQIQFTADYVQKFDQAGLLLVFTKPGVPRKWIKAGVEFYEGYPRLSTVCCDQWADWSVAPLTDAAGTSSDSDAVKNGDKAVEIRVRREDDATGRCLWVYRKLETGEMVPMREICWPYGDEDGEGWQVEICAAVARPGTDRSDSFQATFGEHNITFEE